MITLRNNLIRTFTISAILSFLAIAAGLALAGDEQVPVPTPAGAGSKAPNADGFIQRWVILEPIAANGDTQNVVQQIVKTEHFPGELTVIPRDGDKVTLNNDSQLTWHATDTSLYNLNLYYFAAAHGTNCNNALFWAVTIINCPQEMRDVRLAIGSNSASVWWVNGEEVIGIYGNRCTVIDDGVSKRLTLRRGANVIRGGIVNASGAADFCARFLDSEDKPLQGFTVNLNAAR